jgi:hypothetical protein
MALQYGFLPKSKRYKQALYPKSKRYKQAFFVGI